ncbi:MAG: hypothetical protein K1X74_07390 [Pirellulales bacterium]|nr:hypothetical protein [Pirellulales bacterium]
MRTKHRQSRRGAISVLMCFMMVLLLSVVALSIDLGYLFNARSELQRAADSAALAGAWELIPTDESFSTVPVSDFHAVRDEALMYASLNHVCRDPLSMDRNEANAATGELVIGELVDLAGGTMSFLEPNSYNAVKVWLLRTAARNGRVPLFFARIFGKQGQDLEATATAALITQIDGFQTPGDAAETLDLLPFALDIQTWNGMLAGGGTDNWTWDFENKSIKAGADGIREVNLYPQGTGSPGNRGTVDIGPSNNSTNDIARQILHGVSAEDLEHFDGELRFDDNGELGLNGDTGISAGVKDELAAIKGQPRMIPIFKSVAGPGNNAQYTIVQFAGIRIMEVKLTGSMSGKKVIIQPAPVVSRGTIAHQGSGTTSYYIYSPARLVKGQ